MDKSVLERRPLSRRSRYRSAEHAATAKVAFWDRLAGAVRRPHVTLWGCLQSQGPDSLRRLTGETGQLQTLAARHALHRTGIRLYPRH